MNVAARPPLAGFPLVLAALLPGCFCLQTTMADGVLRPLDVRQVQVGGEIGRRIDVTVSNNLLILDADKDFLAPFKTRTAHEGYIGLGKLIDATVRLAAYTKNEKAIALRKHLVDEVINAQEPDGYIGSIKPEGRMWALWDIHEMGYIIFGLTTDYHYFKEKRALDTACKLADYILDRWPTMPADWPRQTGVATHVSVTGLERTLLTLHRETGRQRYLDFVVRQRAMPEWNLRIVMGRRNLIEGHAYAYLVRCLAQLELYRSQPQASLLSPTRRAMRFLSAADGLTITGATGQAEIWTDDQDGRNCLGETCTTAYQIRVYDSLLRMEGNARYGDLMERAIYNTLFAAQSPDGRKIRYFTPFEGNRTYFAGDTYCCPCNYRRIIAELPATVFYQSGNGLAVNLYTRSTAVLSLNGDVSLKVSQETDYPTSGHVVLRLEPSQPAAFPLRLRIPKWCDAATVAINGKPVGEAVVPGTFLTVERQWKRGDQVTLDMPMRWRLVAGRKRQAGRAAVMRGPSVFCLNPTQSDALKNQDAADLSYIMIDPGSLKDASGGGTARPGDVACEVAGENNWAALGVGGSLSLKLTEFPDPDGRCIYFRLPDPNAAVPDELVGDM